MMQRNNTIPTMVTRGDVHEEVTSTPTSMHTNILTSYCTRIGRHGYYLYVSKEIVL